MKELEEIIDVNTEGNYLFSSSDKAQMMSEILDLFGVSQQRELLSQYNSFVNMQYHSVELDDTDITDFTDWVNCG